VLEKFASTCSSITMICSFNAVSIATCARTAAA
jgi:hypothetical protein